MIAVLLVIYCVYRTTDRHSPPERDQDILLFSNKREYLHSNQQLSLKVDNLSENDLVQTNSAEERFSSDENYNASLRSTITGKVKITGSIPADKRIPVESDPQCTMIRNGEMLLQEYKVDDHGGLSDVLVFLDLTAKVWAQDLHMQAQMLDRTKCEFQPRVLGMHSSQILIIRNSDPVIHDIHFFPEILKQEVQSRAQLPNGKECEYTFDGISGIFQVRCHVHLWMYAYVGVFDHPFFATSGEHGEFSLQGVPSGDYTLRAFHPNAGRLSVPVHVVPSLTTEVDLYFK